MSNNTVKYLAEQGFLTPEYEKQLTGSISFGVQPLHVKPVNQLNGIGHSLNAHG